MLDQRLSDTEQLNRHVMAALRRVLALAMNHSPQVDRRRHVLRTSEASRRGTTMT